MMQTTAKIALTQSIVILNQCSLENQKYIEGGKRRKTASNISLITRLTVTMTVYLRCKASARYRSKLISVMIDNDAKARTKPTAYTMVPEMQYREKFVVKEPM